MRAARPDIALSGDFIVGFPGETDEDFEATLKLVDEVGYAAAYSFKYSAAAGHSGRNDGGSDRAEIMDERLQRLQERINAHSSRSTGRKWAATRTVLIERKGGTRGQMIGKTPGFSRSMSRPTPRPATSSTSRSSPPGRTA